MSTFLANLFLVCFFGGFVLSLVSFLFGGDHGFGDHDGGMLHIGHDGDVGGYGEVGHAGGVHVPFFSYSGILLFLTWFGGVGYILNNHVNAALVVTLVGAVFAGFAGAGLIYLFFAKYLVKGQTIMNPRDYKLPGTLAKVCSAIRPGETGEIVYVHGGTRKTLGARSDVGAGHPQGEEVVIVRCDKGIAYVRSVAADSGDV